MRTIVKILAAIAAGCLAAVVGLFTDPEAAQDCPALRHAFRVFSALGF
jgi:hypothetical protein